MRGRGFTLIELMVVIVVLSVAAALAMPRVGAVLPGAELRSAGTRLATDMRYLYAYAVSRREYVRLAIDLDKNAYWAETFTPETPDDDGRVVAFQLRTDFSLAAESRQVDVRDAQELRDAVVGRRELPPRVDIEEVEIAGGFAEDHGVVYIEFSPWGYGDDATVVLARDDTRRRLRLNGLLGEADLERYER